MSTRTRRLLGIPALLALAAAMGTIGQAQATAGPAASPPAQVLTEDEAIDEPGNGVQNCNGFAQEFSLTTMNDLPTNVGENGAFVTLPGAVITFNTPMNDADKVHVLFSAEARLLGQPNTFVVPVDFLQIQVLLDGVPMPPLNDLTFTTDVGHALAAQACKRMPAVGMGVMHTIEVQYLIVDQGMNQNLFADIDDWAVTVFISG